MLRSTGLGDRRVILAVLLLSTHGKDRGVVQILGLDGRAAIVSEHNDRSDDQLQADLLDLQLQG